MKRFTGGECKQTDNYLNSIVSNKRGVGSQVSQFSIDNSENTLGNLENFRQDITSEKNTLIVR